MTKTQRLINRINEKESFYDVAYVCEDFETFEIEVAEWGCDHIAGVDFDDPELDREQLDAIFCFIRLYSKQSAPLLKNRIRSLILMLVFYVEKMSSTSRTLSAL